MIDVYEVLPLANSFCPLKPTAKQQMFFDCDAQEVFFGGAAGGGKSCALLMAALKYVRFPGYSALIIRKDLPRMELAGGLIPRPHEWLKEAKHFCRRLGGPAARWIASRRQWIFSLGDDHVPSSLTFGYLSRPTDKYRYASSEFQYIAFDELTDFAEDDYLFLFSRLRRNTGYKVPLRMRSASNPGGLGHAWVKQRFIPEGIEVGDQRSDVGDQKSEVGNLISDLRSLTSCPDSPDGIFSNHGRLYIPSRITDNQHLDAEEYRRSLMHLSPVVRERLMNGDWSVQEQGLIQAGWLRYFIETRSIETGEQLELLEPSGRINATLSEGSCRRFVTIDPAGTSAERTREARGREPSWTVAQVWDQPRRELSKFLLLRHQARVRVGFDGLCRTIREVFAAWRPERVWIEGEKLGQAAFDVLKKELPIECLRIGVSDKATRAGRLLLKLERGEIFLPRHETTWRPAFEAELLAWTGDERQVADQIDAAAYAAIVAGDGEKEPIRIHSAVVRS